MIPCKKTWLSKMGRFHFLKSILRPKINLIFLKMIFVSEYLFRRTAFISIIINLFQFQMKSFSKNMRKYCRNLLHPSCMIQKKRSFNYIYLDFETCWILPKTLCNFTTFCMLTDKFEVLIIILGFSKKRSKLVLKIC